MSTIPVSHVVTDSNSLFNTRTGTSTSERMVVRRPPKLMEPSKQGRTPSLPHGKEKAVQCPDEWMHSVGVCGEAHRRLGTSKSEDPLRLEATQGIRARRPVTPTAHRGLREDVERGLIAGVDEPSVALVGSCSASGLAWP